MKKLSSLFLLPLVAGCLSASTPSISQWILRYRSEATAVPAKYGVVRVTQASVRSPYDGNRIAVLRSDGSVAFDPYNEYAAEPSQMVRGVTYDALEGSGLFTAVLPRTSLATESHSVELQVLSLALDCRDGGGSSRKAVADVVLRLIGTGGELKKTVKGSGAVPLDGSDFGAALSRALSAALEQAIAQLN